MTYVLIDTDTLEILEGPWHTIPGRVQLAPSVTVSPAGLGDEHEGRRIVEIVTVGDEPSPHHILAGHSQSLEGNTLTRTREWAEAPQPTAEEIKEEAGRRILEAYPDWKQRNMTMRAVQLQGKLIAGGTWSAEEAAEAAAIEGVADWVTAIRERSDELEDTLPFDYRDDAHWVI